jgi:2-polyprenyl-3-methyl-5-hydroxy-6-metoxy-1,4-benzoquinol methylase
VSSSATNVIASGDRSYRQAVKRFSAPRVAKGYPSEFRPHHWRDRRERQCIIQALGGIAPGSRVLDLPCGTGRLTRLLVDQGFRVTGADVSEAMLACARRNHAARRSDYTGAFPHVEFARGDIMQTGYPDGHFDAVVCNRLFHHLTEHATRLRALAELRRISRGPVVVSFFNTFALDALYRRLRDTLRGRARKDRLPIPYATLAAEMQSTGFRIQKKIAVRWGLSPHWYVVAA